MENRGAWRRRPGPRSREDAPQLRRRGNEASRLLGLVDIKTGHLTRRHDSTDGSAPHTQGRILVDTLRRTMDQRGKIAAKRQGLPRNPSIMIPPPA